jgi:uncharacterized protein YpbB
MLKKNVSIESIATERGLSLATVLSHLEKLKDLKAIDDNHLSFLKDRLPKQDFEMIFAELQQSEDGKLKPIYDKFAGKYSYASIQLVKLLSKTIA